MTSSPTPIVPPVSVPSEALMQHAGLGAGALGLVQDAHLVVDERDVPAGAGRSPTIAARRASSSALTGPLPSAVCTSARRRPRSDRGLGLHRAVVALLDDHAPASRPNSGRYSPASRRIRSSNEPSAASKW